MLLPHGGGKATRSGTLTIVGYPPDSLIDHPPGLSGRMDINKDGEHGVIHHQLDITFAISSTTNADSRIEANIPPKSDK